MANDSVPSGWSYVRLSDLGEVNRGRSRHRPRYAEHLYGGPYPFVQTGDIRASGGRITSHTQTYSEEGLAQSRLWPVGTMCITIAANIAETAILTYPACFPDSVIGFIADETKCDVRCVEYIFRNLKRRIQFEASGTVQDNINLGTLESLRFALPPLPVQRRIADVLGRLDDKIELNRRMNRTLEKMAAAIFKCWFIDFDPVHAKAEGRDPNLPAEIADLFPDSFEESELGAIPKGWDVKPLDEVADYLNGLACQKHPPVEGQKSLPVIKIRELRQGITNNTDRAAVDVPLKYIVEDGDVLFSWSGSLLVSIWCNGRGVLNQHVFKVTSESFAKWYFYQATKHHLDEFQRIASDKATTMGHIKRHHLTEAKMAIPGKELMAKGTEVLGTMLDRRINALKQVRILALIRDTLLPRLLSGEIELPEAEALVEEGI